jgi:perosamine synthetase
MIADRQRVARLYDAALGDAHGLTPLEVPAGGSGNYYKYVAVLKEKRDRAALKKELKSVHGVSLSGEVYEAPLHEQPVFREYASGPLPQAEDLCARHVCLPVFSGMEDAAARQVIDAVRAVIG